VILYLHAERSAFVAANRHPGQAGYSHKPSQEVRGEASGLRTDPGKEGEGQVAHAAGCAAFERYRQSDLSVFWSLAALFYIWKQRYEKHGVAGLRDMSRRPHNIRFRIPPEIVSLIARIWEERRYGAVRVSLFLQCYYHAYVSPTTILKIFHHHHHVGRISLKKYRPGPKPLDASLQVPGRPVQLDVKFVPRVGRARQRFYQFTVIDEATRFRVLRIYDHDNTKTAIGFLHEVREHFPFAIQRIQTDNSSSFGPQFTWHLSDLRISHKHIPTGCPEVNGKVERSHKTDSQEIYRRMHIKHKRDLARKLKKWETKYNEDRLHIALKGRTPAGRVCILVQSSKPVRALSHN
jgi:transposase InsO family protein